MKKVVRRIFIFILIVFCMIIPLNSKAYEFESAIKEERVKQRRREIYDLYNMYKEVINEKEAKSKFGVMNYNGVCSTVTVDGKTISLDDYIAGVIKQEMGTHNLEALKAQAIAARSFLLNTKANSASCSVGNGEFYQAYQSANANNEADKIYYQAVYETSGMVVSRNGEIAHTQYVSHPDKTTKYSIETENSWILTMQRFNDDLSTEWTWIGPNKTYVRKTAGGGYLYGTDSLGDKSHHYGMSQTVAVYLAKAEGYTYEQLIELFYAEPIVTLSDGVYDADIKYKTESSSFGQITYFAQGNYGNYYFSSDTSKCTIKQGGDCATIKSHGCGPTSVAIVASSMLGKNITPIETTQKVCQNGGCLESGSINQTLADTLSKNYGLKVTTTTNDQEVADALATKNALVIAHMGPGTFTSGGHYIVLTGIRSDKMVSVADPGSENRTQQKWFPFNTIIEEKKNQYIIIKR